MKITQRIWSALLDSCCQASYRTKAVQRSEVCIIICLMKFYLFISDSYKRNGKIYQKLSATNSGNCQDQHCRIIYKKGKRLPTLHHKWTILETWSAEELTIQQDGILFWLHWNLRDMPNISPQKLFFPNDDNNRICLILFIFCLLQELITITGRIYTS